jgi:hypothetical protein
MPQNIAPGSLLTALKQQTAKALAPLLKEIARREQELAVLKGEAARWKSVVRGQAKTTNAAVAARRAPGAKKRRLDWSAILADLPTKFTAKDVAEKTGKPMEQVYAGVARWVKDKKAKKGKGGYQKAPTPTPARSREKAGASA